MGMMTQLSGKHEPHISTSLPQVKIGLRGDVNRISMEPDIIHTGFSGTRLGWDDPNSDPIADIVEFLEKQKTLPKPYECSVDGHILSAYGYCFVCFRQMGESD